MVKGISTLCFLIVAGLASANHKNNMPQSGLLFKDPACPSKAKTPNLRSYGEFPIPDIPDDFETNVQSWLWQNGTLTDLEIEFHHKRSAQLNMMWDEEMTPSVHDPMDLDT